MIEPTLTSAPAEVLTGHAGEVGARRRSRVSRLRRDDGWALARLALDSGMLLAAAIAASLGSHAASVEPAPAGWLALFSVLVVVVFAFRGMYRSRLRADVLDDLRGVVVATTLAAMAVLTFRELFAEPSHLSAQTIRPWVFATAYLAAGHVALHWSRAQSRRHGEGLRPTLIVGAGRVGRLVAKRLQAQPDLGLEPVGFLDRDPLAASDGDGRLPVLGASWDLERVVAEYDVQQVIVTFSTAPNEVLLRLARRCEELGIDVAFVPRLFERMSQRLTIDYIGGVPLVVARRPDPKGFQFAVKYAVDRAVAVALLFLAAPVMIASAVAVWISLGRPLFFRQRRVGRDGREFDMLKFRTMREVDDVASARCELPPDTAPGGVEGIDRRTPFGAFLRRSSIDELPQLFNVLKGQMSLVGPRPERPEFVDVFEQSVYRYGDRHRVKSGITGWSQVNGLRGKTSLADRVEWDNYYIENWSLWLDFKIVLLTFTSVLRFSRQAE